MAYYRGIFNPLEIGFPMGSGIERGVVQRRLHRLKLDSTTANSDNVRRMIINASCLDEYSDLKVNTTPSGVSQVHFADPFTTFVTISTSGNKVPGNTFRED